MFNLDDALADWRRQMAAGGITTPDALEELESHLRDDMDRETRNGVPESRAFETAVQSLGLAPQLKNEFDKVGLGTVLQNSRLKEFLFTLAGIPNLIPTTNMNTSITPLEPRWATYAKAGAFVTPAVVLWFFIGVFVFPKLQQICANAGVAYPSIFDAPAFFVHNGTPIFGAIIAAFALLEWRSGKWAQYRKAAVSLTAFTLNAAVLTLITLMVVLALLVAPALLHQVK